MLLVIAFVRAVEQFLRHDQYRVFCLLAAVPPFPSLCRPFFCPGQHLIERATGMNSGEIRAVSMSSLNPLLRDGSRVRVAHDGLSKIIHTVIKVKPCCTPHVLAVRIVVVGIGSPSYRILDSHGISCYRLVGGILGCTHKAVHLVEHVDTGYPISVVHERFVAN